MRAAADLGGAVAAGCVLTALALWFGLSVVAQWRGGRLVARLTERDLVGAVPLLTFFAPTPVTSDFHVLYRDRWADGALSPWRELDEDRASPLRALWNPTLRVHRAMADLCAAVLRAAAHPDAGRMLLVQVPYLLLLGRVSARPAGPGAESRQFSIARAPGRGNEASAEVLFVSRFHRLP